jgi:hypothetical protein
MSPNGLSGAGHQYTTIGTRLPRPQVAWLAPVESHGGPAWIALELAVPYEDPLVRRQRSVGMIEPPARL